MVAIFSIIYHKGGFSAIEALLGFFLFSGMMALYLPGFTQNLSLFKQTQENTQQWAVFESLVKLDDQDARHVAIERYNQQHPHGIANYYDAEGEAMITFTDGTELSIHLIDIN